METTPEEPSTRSIIPDLMIFVACPVPTTAGSPYSRQTIAAWLMTPPTSVTQALILAKAGAQEGEVVGATRISPSCNCPTSDTVLQTRARPSTMPGLPAKPLSSVMLSGSLTSCTADQSASDLLVTPQSTMVNGSWITSGGVPMAGGAVHFLELLHDALAPENLLRPNFGAAWGDPGRPGRDYIPQTLLDLVATQQPDIIDVVDHAVLLHDHGDFAHLVPEDRMEPVFDVEEMVLNVGEHRLGAAKQLVELLPVRFLLD